MMKPFSRLHDFAMKNILYKYRAISENNKKRKAKTCPEQSPKSIILVHQYPRSCMDIPANPAKPC